VAWQQLPIWARKQIITKKIRVFTLRGSEAATDVAVCPRFASLHWTPTWGPTDSSTCDVDGSVPHQNQSDAAGVSP
jgi:hypothetical protein